VPNIYESIKIAIMKITFLRDSSQLYFFLKKFSNIALKSLEIRKIYGTLDQVIDND